MNRRGFIGAISALVAAPAVGVAAVTAPAAPQAPPTPRVMRADGKRFIVGVAMETVHAGDFVQIQTYGPASIRVSVRGSD